MTVKPTKIELHLSLPEYYSLRHKLDDLLPALEPEPLVRVIEKVKAIGDRLPRRRTTTKGECNFCDTHHEDKMMPSHDPSPRCESGKKPHCTCDTCF